MSVGCLKEMCFAEIEESHQSPQAALDEWTDHEETFVAVVSQPANSGIDELCDEHRPELGMPSAALKRFWETRAGYRGNSAVDEPHNKAYEDCELDKAYKRQLRKPKAQRSVKELATRVASGENITLVCFERDGLHCHRHLLLERIREQVETSEQSQFKFVVPS